MRRKYTAPLLNARCRGVVTLRDGTTSQCMHRRAAGSEYCRQHVGDRFALCGHVLTHTRPPRFRLTFAPRPDGGFEFFGEPEWLDGPPPKPDAPALARLMREAGDFFAREHRRDWLQEAAIQQANKLKLSSYEIAKRAGGAVSEDHVRAYLTGAKSMGSHKLQHVLRVLGLNLVER